jgi:L-asparaginase
MMRRHGLDGKHMPVPALIIHGGAGAREGLHASFRRYADSLEGIVEDAWRTLLDRGARAAVLAAVRALEDDPIFNAGLGSRLQADGVARMSAALMDGRRGRFSGVVNVERIRHPIDVADHLQAARHAVLAGSPAGHYARHTLGMADFDPVTEHRREEHARRSAGRSGTVGAVAVDATGALWAATSTGGVGNETPGRMSDSATVAGNYATAAAGVSCTGIGEHIVDHAAAVRVVLRVEDGDSIEAAVERTIREADERSLEYGLIALDAAGQAVAGRTRDVTTLWCARNERGRSGFHDEETTG